MTPDDPISDADLDAFIDGELDEAARLAVERRLASRPELAARVMADMAAGHELRVLAGHTGPDDPVTKALAQQLATGLAGHRRRSQWARIAAVGLIFAGGWVVGQFGFAPRTLEGATPEFVEEALMSHRTALVRARMDSQPEVTAYDPREIQAATNIALPDIPATWRVTDTQVYPSDEGPSIGMAFVTPRGPVSLFAFNTQKVASIRLSLLRRDRGQVAYWQTGGMAYALIGAGDRRDLAAMAGAMARTPITAASPA